VDEQIERVENKSLYQMYHVSKSMVEQRNKPDVCNERLLWHGTTLEAAENICMHGFNRAYCGRNGEILPVLDTLADSARPSFCLSVCSFVCLFVRSITQNRMIPECSNLD